MTPGQARKLADRTHIAVLTLRRSVEVLKGERDPLLMIVHDNLSSALNSIKHSVEMLNQFQGSN